MSSPYRHWTTGDIARLRELRAAGVPYAELGPIFGRTPDAVQRKAQQVGIAEPRTDLRGRIMRKVMIDADTGCWIWQGMVRKGQPSINLLNTHRGNGRERNPRAVLLQLDGKWRPVSAMAVATCADPMCIAPAHARQLTRAQHLKRARSTGVGSLGPAHAAKAANNRRARSALTWNMVRKARQEDAEGVPRAQTLAWWPYSKQSLNDVLAGRSWREAPTGASVFSWRPQA